MGFTMLSSALPLPQSKSSIISLPTQSHNRCDHRNQPSLIPIDSPSQIQQHHASPNPPPKIGTVRYRLSQLCKQGQPHLARQLFDSIPRPTTVVWNAIIIGFICNNMPSEALSFYACMKSSLPDTECDYYTYSATLKACAQTKQLNIGKAVHCHILRSHTYPSRIVCNSLLNMYATCVSYIDHGLDFTRNDLVQRVFGTMRKRDVVAWNTMISWYAKTNRCFQAVRHFMLMMKFGVKPSVVSFVNVFPAASGLGDINTVNVLYGMLIKLGSEYVNDLFAVSSAISMYAEAACLEFARKIFDHSLETNTEVWNSMIGSYVQNNSPVDALDLFLLALGSQHALVLDDVTFLSALTAASQLQQLYFAKQLHAYKIKDSSMLRVIILNAIISLYSRCNCIDDAFKVFNGMQERDVVSWNTMVSAFVQNGFDGEGLMLVHEMQKQGFPIDSVIATALLSAASNLRDQDIGKQTHGYLVRHRIQFEGVESYLVHMYAQCGLIKAAQTLFEVNSTNGRDHATWNAMIAGNTKNGLIHEAFIIFRQLIEQNVTPNAVTLSSILPACTLMGCIALGKQLHCFAIRNSLDQNVFVHSALVDMYSKSGAIAYAESVFANSPERNSVAYTNMILGYGQHGMGEKALELFCSMRVSGIKPDAVTFVAVLAACSCNGLVEEGLQIFESMEREHGIRLSAEHYCCVVDMLGRAGRVDEAYEFVTDVGEQDGTSRIWGSLLAACRINGQFKMGKIVADKLLEMEGHSMTGYHVLLSNIYAEEGNWNYVNRVRKAMWERGLTKEIGCSWIDVAGHVNCFVSRDRMHRNCDDLYEMLKELAINMKDAGHIPRLESHLG